MKRFALLALVSLSTIAQVGAIQPNGLAQSTPIGRGFVWSNGSGLSGISGASGAPTAYQFNTTGGINTVTKTATGRYTVQFPGLGTNGGNVQVSAYGGRHRCKVMGWMPIGTVQTADVACFTPNGTPVDAAFTALFENYPAPNSTLYQQYKKAYVWADQPAAASYTPAAGYSYNSNNSVNTIQRLGVGDYAVRLGRMNQVGGNVLVTAYGNNSDYCKVQNWLTGNGDTIAKVRCFDTTGQPADSRFSLSYQMNNTLMGSEYSDFYAWVNGGFADPTYQHNGAFAGSTTAASTGIGTYAVTLPVRLTAYKTGALVTAYGNNSDYCNIMSWNTAASATTSQVNVACFSAQGQPVNSAFTQRLVTNSVVPW